MLLYQRIYLEKKHLFSLYDKFLESGFGERIKLVLIFDMQMVIT